MVWVGSVIVWVAITVVMGGSLEVAVLLIGRVRRGIDSANCSSCLLDLSSSLEGILISRLLGCPSLLLSSMLLWLDLSLLMGPHSLQLTIWYSRMLSVMIDLLLLVAGHWDSQGEFKRQQITMRRAWTQRVKTVTRTSSTMTREWSRSMMMSCTVTGVEQEGKLQMDSLRDCLSYCSSIYTFYKYVLVWHNQW